jgi:flagellar biosynthesis protein
MKQQQKIAVALEYDEKNAPRVSAKGVGDLAQQIIDMAKQTGVPLQQDDELVEILAEISLGEEIPEQLYRAVAEVLAFAYILRGKFPAGFVAD